MKNNKPISVNISGYLQAELGVGEVGRILARAADHAGIEYATLTSRRTLNRQNFGFEERTLANSSMINLIAVNADQMKIWAQDVGAEVVENRYNIGVWSWELENFPEIFDEAFKYVDEIWAISEFSRDAIKQRTNKPVFAIPLHVENVDPGALEKLDRGPLGILPNDQYFLFMFDFLSDLDRKNPLGLIEAFKIAFAPNAGPKLVIKTINGEIRGEDLEKVHRAIDNRADIVVFDGYLDKSQRTSLIAECISYVSLHRSEGYGLTMAEAMSLGKPVIATDYSANCEFMSSEDSLLVPYELISTTGNPTYPYNSNWAAPNNGAAADLMRKVVFDSNFASMIGQNALVAQHNRASVKNTSDFLLKRLTEVNLILDRDEKLELSIPEGWLEKLTRGREVAQVDLQNLIELSDALAHSRMDLNNIEKSNILVRLSRKLLARINAPFEQYDRLRHQSHVAINVALTDAVKFLTTELEYLDSSVHNLKINDAKLVHKVIDLENQISSLLLPEGEFGNQIASLFQESAAHQSVLEDLGRRLDLANFKTAQLSTQLRALPYLNDPTIFALRKGTEWTMGYSSGMKDSKLLHLVDVFRPPQSELYSNLRRYQKYFPSQGYGIDLGCGRGEMLQVMREYGLEPLGIDNDEVCIAECLKEGLRAKNIDVLSFLRQEPSQSCEVVSAIHIIEHVSYEVLREWMQEIHRILKNDGVFVLETPNPHAIDALKAFWVDPTHVRPYYPESMLVSLQEVGFRSAHVDVQGEQLKVLDRLEFAGSYSLVAKK